MCYIQAKEVGWSFGGGRSKINGEPNEEIKLSDVLSDAENLDWEGAIYLPKNEMGGQLRCNYRKSGQLRGL
ncbi:hypothetical protein [Pseudomonas syringae]|uniref:Uncharacterized protein n=1 Tax=Pseudomonas syringae pv. actinidifoliorum ICMP 18803 TaxID=1194400 RepID=A0AAT9SGZ0_PSESX|nr:hypothetical protein [Pseudomonas syringae]UYS80523.1 hypothetical protein A237_024320 [Pseudomonas syringae pv. actinidifoliorum ICMP 18803]